MKPSYKPEAPIPATEDALLEKMRTNKGGAAEPQAGAGPPPPMPEGPGAAGKGQDSYYGDYWATQGDLHTLREEIDAAHADLYHKLERIEAMVLQLHQKFCPGELSVWPPPPPPAAEPRPPAAQGSASPVAGPATAPVVMEQ